jgi:hypothetical protein
MIKKSKTDFKKILQAVKVDKIGVQKYINSTTLQKNFRLKMKETNRNWMMEIFLVPKRFYVKLHKHTQIRNIFLKSFYYEESLLYYWL